MTEPLVISHGAALGMIPSGRYLPEDARGGARRVLVVALRHDCVELAELADELLTLQLRYPYIKPIFLTTVMDASSLTNAGFLYETAMPAAMWRDAGFQAAHDAYLEARIGEMAATYQVARVTIVEPGEHVPLWVVDR